MRGWRRDVEGMEGGTGRGSSLLKRIREREGLLLAANLQIADE